MRVQHKLNHYWERIRCFLLRLSNCQWNWNREWISLRMQRQLRLDCNSSRRELHL
jgi:hypothetical protein